MSLAEELRKLVADAVNIETYLINNRLPWSEVSAIREGLQRTLALAEAQEKGLAALRWQVSILKTTCECHCKVIEEDEKQHSADLLAIAELAIRTCENSGYIPAIQPSDILREFREKKAKAASEPKERR